MHPLLLDELAAARVDDLLRQASRERLALPLLRPSPAGAGGAALAARARVTCSSGPACGWPRPASGRARRPERGVRRLTDAHAPEPGPRTYLDGVRAAAPIGVAALAFGVSFGVLARAADMGRVAPVVMSVTTFAGSAQFAVASILGAGGGPGHGDRRRRPAQPPLRPDRPVRGLHLRGPVVAAGPHRPADRRRVLGHRPARGRPPGPAPAGRGRPAPARLLDDRHGHRRLRRRPGRRPRVARPRRRLPGPVPGPALVPGPRPLPPPGRPRRRRHRPGPDALHRPRDPDRRRQPGLPGRSEAPA